MKKFYLLFFTILSVSMSFGQITLQISGTDAPANGSTITDDPETVNNATIDFETTNFNVGEPETGTQGDGYIVWEVRNQNGNNLVVSGNIYTANDNVEYPISNLVAGNTYILRAELVDNSGVPLSPAVIYTITVIISEYIDVPDLGELRSQTPSPNNYYRVLGQVINTFSDSDTEQIMYFEDGNAGIKVYDPNFEVQSYQMGDAVSNIRGHLELNNGILEFIPTFANWGPPDTQGSVPGIQSVTANTLSSNWSAYESELVKITNATFTDAGSPFILNNNYVVTDASGSIDFKTEFSTANYLIGGQNTIPSGGQDIVAIVTGSSITARNSSDFSIALSIDDLAADNLKVYPNPTSLGYVIISSRGSSKIDVMVFDIIGKEIIRNTISNNTLDVSDLKTGVYLLKISQDDAVTTKKLVIK